MRRPALNLCLWLGLLAVGAALLWAGNAASGLVAGVLLVPGAGLVGCAPFFIARAALATIGYARLSAGRGSIARWRVSPTEWEFFRRYDAERCRQSPTLFNELRLRTETAQVGIDVIVGVRHLIVDGSYHVLRPRGIPELRAVRWLGEPPGLECLEFGIAYWRRSGGSVALSLRVPVSAAARDQARRAFDHYRALLSTIPKEGLAFRKRKLVLGGGLVVMLASAVVAGTGWAMHASGVDRETSAIVIAIGIAGAIAAAFVTAVLALATRTASTLR